MKQKQQQQQQKEAATTINNVFDKNFIKRCDFLQLFSNA